MPDFSFIANPALIQVQPVSAYLRGRAMQMAFQTETLQQQQMQQQIEDYPKQQEFERQKQMAEFAVEQQEKQRVIQTQQATALRDQLYAVVTAADPIKAGLEFGTAAGMDTRPQPGTDADAYRSSISTMMRKVEMMAGLKAKTPKYGETTRKVGDQWITYETLDGRPVREVSTAPRYKPVVPGAGDDPAGQKALQERFGKPESGYRITPDGAQEPIPGGSAAAKKTEGYRAIVTSIDSVMGAIDEIMPSVGYTTAGTGGAMLRKVPGTPAYDLAAQVDSVKANLGFTQLQQMRAASPTGGALGQVTERELGFLQATIATLDPDMSPTALREALAKVKRHYENWKQTVMEADSGGNGGAGSSSDVVEGQKRRNKRTGEVQVFKGGQWVRQ